MISHLLEHHFHHPALIFNEIKENKVNADHIQRCLTIFHGLLSNQEFAKTATSDNLIPKLHKLLRFEFEVQSEQDGTIRDLLRKISLTTDQGHTGLGMAVKVNHLKVSTSRRNAKKMRLKRKMWHLIM